MTPVYEKYGIMFLKLMLAYNFEYNLKENKILSFIRITFRYLNIHTLREKYKNPLI